MSATRVWRLFLLARDFLALLARLGERDGDRLLAAFHLAAFPALAALRLSPLVAVHLALHFGACAGRVFAFPLLGHISLLDKRFRQYKGSHPAENVRSHLRVPSRLRNRNCPRRVWLAYCGACHESAAFPSPTPIWNSCHRSHRLRG